jgi:hypothetical protein
MQNVYRKTHSFLALALLLVVSTACTPSYKSASFDGQPGALGDDLGDGTGEYRVFPDGTRASITQFLNERLPCNSGSVSNLHARLLAAGCSDLRSIAGLGTDNETTEKLQTLCPVPVLSQDVSYFLELGQCSGTCPSLEIEFTLGIHGCAFHSADSMLQ